MVAHLPVLDALFVKGKYNFYEDVNLQNQVFLKKQKPYHCTSTFDMAF